MGYYLSKVALSAVIIVAVSELAKRSSLIGALVASIPLTSFLAILWLYAESRDTQSIATLSESIFWLVLPSLSFFLIFPRLLRHGLGFWVSLGSSSLAMILLYLLTTFLMKRFHLTS